MLIFKKITYRNFLSTGTSPVEIELDKHDSTLIVGANGKGKSTLLDALAFGLFGKAHRNIKNDQLINSINGKRLLVEIDLVLKSRNDQEIKIVRGMKPRKFEIYINGKLVNQTSRSKEQQRYLEQSILKMNYKSFSQIVILGSNTFIPFMSLDKSVRRNVIEDILDIHVFGHMNTLAKEEQGRVHGQITEIDSDLWKKSDLVSRERTEIETLQNILNNNRQQTAERITSQISAYETYRDNNLQKREATIAKLLTESQRQVDLDRQLKIEMGPGYDTNKESEAKNNLHSFVVKMKDRKRRLMSLTDFLMKNKTCPTCEQQIDMGFRNSKLTENDNTCNELDRAIPQAENHLKDFESRFNNIKSLMDTIRQSNDEIVQLNSKIESNTTNINDYQKQIDSLKQEIESLDESDKGNKDISTRIQEKEQIIIELQAEIETKEKTKTELDRDRHYNALILEMLHDSGIRTRVIKQYLPAINHFINKYLGMLDLFVSFELDEEFNETIKARHLDNFSYTSFSEGQKQRIDLALIFTWREIARMKNTVSTNLLILDETLDASLDVNGIDSLMKILKYNMAENTNIFVISHKEELLENKFNSKIIFDKKHNFSCMDQIDLAETAY